MTIRLDGDCLTCGKRIEELEAAINRFKRFARHKRGQEIRFFRFLAQNARDQKRECADTLVWDTVADALEVAQKQTGFSEIDADCAEPECGSEDPWEPIETAPKHGSYIVINSDGEYALSTEDCRHWEYATFEATHWMPIPKPPKGA